MIGIVGLVGVGSRFVPNNALPLFQMHRVRLQANVSEPIVSSLQENGAILVEEFEAPKALIARSVAHLDLPYLLWLRELDAGPAVFRSPRAAASSIPQHQLVLTVVDLLHSDQIVIVVELIRGWEVSVLLALDLPATSLSHSVLELFCLCWGHKIHSTWVRLNSHPCIIESVNQSLNGLVLSACYAS